MIAVAKTGPGPGRIAVVKVAEPEAGDGDVLLEIEAVGLCGTDLSIYDWHANIAREYNPTFPLVIGHEICGRVVAVGPGVPQSLKGQRVAVNPHLYCNACPLCRRGRTSICVHRKILGCHVNGGAAERLKVRAANVVPLPDGLPPEVGALAEPTAVALHAYERLGAKAWHSVAIFGAGTVGLLLGLTAKSLGLRRVLVVGLPTDEDRLEVARRIGLETCIAVPNEAPQIIRRWSDGNGVDLAIEASGDEAAVLAAIMATSRGGRVGLVGFTHRPTNIHTTDLIFGERDLIAVRAYYASTWDAVVPILAENKETLRHLVTHILPFAEIDRAFDLLRRRQCLKAVLRP